MIPDRVWILEFDNGALAVYTEPKEGAIAFVKNWNEPITEEEQENKLDE